MAISLFAFEIGFLYFLNAHVKILALRIRRIGHLITYNPENKSQIIYDDIVDVARSHMELIT